MKENKLTTEEYIKEIYSNNKYDIYHISTKEYDQNTWHLPKFTIEKTPEEILEEMDIEIIENFLRKKKLQKLQQVQ